MKNKYLLLFFLLIISLSIYCNDYLPIVEFEEYNKIVKSIQNDKIFDSSLEMNAEIDFSKFGEEFKNFKIEARPQFEIVDSFKTGSDIFVLSDIHGQFESFIKLLSNAKVIDKSYNWNFNSGILLINGDTFDRGDDVRKIFWFLYKLKTQAEKKNGKVLHLIGNHELMILRNDLRYVSDFCLAAVDTLGLTYPEAYSSNTFLGSWIRSFSTILKINDMVFVHGGVSTDLMDSNYSISDINKTVLSDFGFDYDTISEKQNLIFRSNGPLWYRGYFKEEVNDNEFEDILFRLDAKKIIVGHTTQDSLLTLYDNKLIAVDAGLKYGDHGEGLLISNGIFFRIDFEGKKHLIK